MLLPALYHWSPSDRFEQIRSEGLRPFSAPTVCTGELVAPYVCLGFSPAGAWMLSGDFIEESDDVAWDLWQVTLAETDSVRVRAEFGPRMQEVKIYGPIPPDRIWHVGRRAVPVFEAR